MTTFGWTEHKYFTELIGAADSDQRLTPALRAQIVAMSRRRLQMRSGAAVTRTAARG